MRIKKFDTFNESNTEDSPWNFRKMPHENDSSSVPSTDEVDFETLKEEMIIKVGTLMKEYYKFTYEVSPKNWRTTGHHYAELRKMKEEIERFEQITPEQKELDWVKKELNDPHGLEEKPFNLKGRH